MRSRLFTRCLVLSVILLSLPALAATPRVDKRISNVFMQSFRNEGFSYIVDPYAQLCFILTLNGGVSEIDCHALKLRSEWQPVIYWIETDEKK